MFFIVLDMYFPWLIGLGSAPRYLWEVPVGEGMIGEGKGDGLEEDTRKKCGPRVLQE